MHLINQNKYRLLFCLRINNPFEIRQTRRLMRCQVCWANLSSLEKIYWILNNDLCVDEDNDDQEESSYF